MKKKNKKFYVYKREEYWQGLHSYKILSGDIKDYIRKTEFIYEDFGIGKSLYSMKNMAYFSLSLQDHIYQPYLSPVGPAFDYILNKYRGQFK